jgi:hypothetical protein
MSITDRIAKFFAQLFGKDLKGSAAAALATVANTKAEIKAEETRLANLKTAAVITVAKTLEKLQSEKEAAEAEEAIADAARLQEVADFDKATAAQEAALQARLDALKAKRASGKSTLEEVNEEAREEFAEEVSVVTDTEAKLLLALADLTEGADAQSGLNNAGK